MTENLVKRELLEYLSGFISENKKKKISELINVRTNYLTLVLEDIFQPHNASAVLRSSDCFGLQQIHIIENKNKYSVNPDIALGSSKWVRINKYNANINNTEDCLLKLKSEGYKIIATMPDEQYLTIEELPIDNKIALMFGTEMNGLSETAIRMSDEFVRIKMYGFTESLNISVSAAICLHYLSSRIRNSSFIWQLTEEEKIETELFWLKNILKHPELLEKEFYRNKNLDMKNIFN